MNQLLIYGRKFSFPSAVFPEICLKCALHSYGNLLRDSGSARGFRRFNLNRSLPSGVFEMNAFGRQTVITVVSVRCCATSRLSVSSNRSVQVRGGFSSDGTVDLNRRARDKNDNEMIKI